MAQKQNYLFKNKHLYGVRLDKIDSIHPRRIKFDIKVSG